MKRRITLQVNSAALALGTLAAILMPAQVNATHGMYEMMTPFDTNARIAAKRAYQARRADDILKFEAQSTDTRRVILTVMMAAHDQCSTACVALD
ncbi:MAG: hypothetical protein AAF862_15550 [Pseudomonadota bacterium]